MISGVQRSVLEYVLASEDLTAEVSDPPGSGEQCLISALPTASANVLEELCPAALVPDSLLATISYRGGPGLWTSLAVRVQSD